MKLQWSSRRKRRRATTLWRAIHGLTIYEAEWVRGRGWIARVSELYSGEVTREYGPFENGGNAKKALEIIYHLEVPK